LETTFGGVRVAAGDPIEPRLIERLTQRLESECGFRLAAIEEIDVGTGHNNRILKLRSSDGRGLVAKLYYNDVRHRLAREFGGLTLLRERGIPGVPEPVLRLHEDRLAVYSLEPGSTPRVQDLTTGDLRQLGKLLGSMARIHPGQPGTEAVLPAVSATFSLADQVSFIRSRMGEFRKHATAVPDAPEVRAALALVSPRQIERFIAQALVGLGRAEIEASVPEARRGFSQG
jgi:hypothetical protein